MRTALAFCVVVALVAVGSVWAASSIEKRRLNRDSIYYEIANDGDDHGNYIETYHVPNGRGGIVYCVVYSDKIGDGGGAGMSCDWQHSGG